MLRYRNARVLLAFLQTLSTWVLHDRLLVMLIPRYLAQLVLLRISLWMVYVNGMQLLLLVIVMTSHLLGLKSISQSCSHCCSLSKSACKASASEVSWIVRYIRQSSAKSLVVEDAIPGRSLIKTKKSRGPRTVPWGTPDVTNEVLEDCPSIKTR